MKTYQEWLAMVHEKPFLLDTENREWVQSIQMDAWLQGRNDAAEIVNDMRGEGESDLRSVRDRIKYSQLKTK